MHASENYIYTFYPKKGKHQHKVLSLLFGSTTASTINREQLSISVQTI